MILKGFHKFCLITGILLAGTWLCFGLFGQWAADTLAKHLGGTILRVGGGKFDDPSAFILGRLIEALWLSSSALLLIIAVMALHQKLQSWCRSRSVHSLTLALVVFAAINAFAWHSGRTILFWSLFFDKANVDNFAQYQIKTTLLRETKNRRRAVLIGNSQTNTNIDEVRMNQLIGAKLWSTELTQPGARGFDTLTLTRNMPLQSGDLVICYLSEVFFYGEGGGGVAADFLTFNELPDLLELNGLDQVPFAAIRSGLIGHMIPLHRYRKSLSNKLLGWAMVNLEQVRFDSSLETNLESQAKRRAAHLRENRSSGFEKAAFRRAVSELTAKGCNILLIAGHTHPALQHHMDPGLRRSMLDFLQVVEAENHGRVSIIDGAEIAVPKEADFVDLVHFGKNAQANFTHSLVSHITTSPSYLENQ